MSNIELARDIKDKKIRYSSLIHSSVCKILWVASDCYYEETGKCHHISLFMIIIINNLQVIFVELKKNRKKSKGKEKH
jgi:hypothetical protein